MKQTRSELHEPPGFHNFGHPRMGDPADVIQLLVRTKDSSGWQTSGPASGTDVQARILKTSEFFGMRYSMQSRCRLHPSWVGVDAFNIANCHSRLVCTISCRAHERSFYNRRWMSLCRVTTFLLDLLWSASG